MNVLNKFIFILILISTITSVYSDAFSACGVTLDEPWFIVNSSDGEAVLVADNDGDIFMLGEDHSLENKNTVQSFEINDNLHFNKITSKFSSFDENLAVLPDVQSMIIKNSLGDEVTKFSKDGNIYTKGVGVYEGAQSNCLADGIYCNGDIVEDRDYSCDVTGDRSGSCKNDIVSSEDCAAKLSVETDAGIDYFNKGDVTDYTTCGSGACLNNTYTDVCFTDTLREYYKSATSSFLTDKNCNDYEAKYCVGDDEVWTTSYGCSSGECNQGADLFVQSCSVTATEYSAWSCADIDTKTRTVTTFSPTCGGAGVCSETSSDSAENVDCGATQYCSGGDCIAYTYIWKTGDYGTCSLTCGGGTQTRSVWCERNEDSVTVDDSYCGGGKPDESQSCNTAACASVLLTNFETGGVGWTENYGDFEYEGSSIGGVGGSFVQSFRIPSSKTINKIELYLRLESFSLNQNNANLKIYQNFGGGLTGPSNLIATSSLTQVTKIGGWYEFQISAPLNSNTIYYIVLHLQNDGASVIKPFSSISSGYSKGEYWGWVADEDFVGWYSESNRDIYFRIYG